MLPGTALPKTTYPTKQGGFRIATIATLVTAWLSTVASGAFGADPRAPTNRPESQGLTSQAPESQTLRVRVNEGLLSLQAIQRPYIEVLDAIQKETGIRFHYSIPMAEAVTLSLKDVPVQQALKRLLGRESQLMFRFPEGNAVSNSGVPDEVWILGEVSGPIAEAGEPIESGPANKSLSSVAEGAVTTAQSSETPAPGNKAQPEVAQTTNAQSEIDSLIETAESEDPTQRLQAVSALAGYRQADQEAVNAVLNAALTDQEAVVRTQAIQALVRRGGPEATGYLEQAMRDQDPGVRIMALESVDPAKHDVDLVKQALFDAHPAVRATAEAMLHPETQ